MHKPPIKKLLLHLDTDPMPSAFDQVVAYDAEVDNIISYGGVTPDNVTTHVHGMMFTRGTKDLKNSAIFIGGSDVTACEQVGQSVKKTFFGTTRVAVMLDPNGSNTTAAAIARKILSSYDVASKKVVIVGAGPVGQRCALYFNNAGASEVIVTSRSLERADIITTEMKKIYNINVIPAQSHNEKSVAALIKDAHVVIASGPAGVCVLPKSAWTSSATLDVIADVNALPPLGVEGIDVSDNGSEKDGVRLYGAIAIGNFKMKLHRRAITSLFENNEQFLDEKTIYDLACELDP